MILLDQNEWTAEACGDGHVVVSVSASDGIRHFARLPLTYSANDDACRNDLVNAVGDGVKFPPVR